MVADCSKICWNLLAFQPFRSPFRLWNKQRNNRNSILIWYNKRCLCYFLSLMELINWISIHKFDNLPRRGTWKQLVRVAFFVCVQSDETTRECGFPARLIGAAGQAGIPARGTWKQLVRVAFFVCIQSDETTQQPFLFVSTAMGEFLLPNYT